MAVALSPVDDTIASASWDGEIRIWNPFLHQRSKVIRPPTKEHKKRYLTFSPDGRRLCESGENNASIFDVQSGDVTCSLPDAPGQFTFRDGGRLVANLTEEGIQLWDLPERLDAETIIDDAAEWIGINVKNR